MSLKLTTLGIHSATPRSDAYPTSQVLELNNHFFLIDCGEGTQMLLRQYRIAFSKIEHIFISHLHGDHFFGLIGLLSSFGLLNRTKTMHIYAPEGLKEIIDLQLQISQSHISFPVEFHLLRSSESELILDNAIVEVRTIPLKHRLYTNGFLFREKPPLLNLDMEAIHLYEEIQRCDYFNLKKGKDFVLKNGKIIPNSKLTLPHKKTKSYAYCSDTSYLPSIVPIIKDVDLLYHEATFLEKDLDLAIITLHSTAKQAAKIAKKAKVGKLILGHFSSRYNGYESHLEEAQNIFDNVGLAEKGKTFEIQ